MRKTYTGINIQWPISQLILSGKKTIETRTYPIPPQYIGKEMLLIETPGKKGKFKSRVIAKIVFSGSYKYASEKAFYRDFAKHRVDKTSLWKWDPKKPKWAWKIKYFKVLKQAVVLQKRKGIIFTKNLHLSS